MIEKRRSFIINVIYFALIAAMGYFILKYLYMWLLPFVIGFFVAMSIQKPVNFLHKKTKIPAKIIAIILVFIILFLLGFAIYGVISWLLGEVGSLATYLSTFFKDFPDTLDSLKTQYPNIFSYLDGSEKLPFVDIDVIFSKGSEMLADFAKIVTNGTINFAKSLPTVLVTFIITVVACCYFSVDYNRVANFIKAQLSHKAKTIIVESKRVFYSSIFKYVKAYSFIILVTFSELSLALLILGIDNAVPLAALISIVDILPVLGVGTVLIPWSIINLILGNYVMALGLIITYAIITVIRNLIEPKIVGDYVGLHPLITLMSMYVGVKLFGGIGLIVLPFTLIILNHLNSAGIVNIWHNLPKQEKKKSKKEKLKESNKA